MLTVPMFGIIVIWTWTNILVEHYVSLATRRNIYDRREGQSTTDLANGRKLFWPCADGNCSRSCQLATAAGRVRVGAHTRNSCSVENLRAAATSTSFSLSLFSLPPLVRCVMPQSGEKLGGPSSFQDHAGGAKRKKKRIGTNFSFLARGFIQDDLSLFLF